MKTTLPLVAFTTLILGVLGGDALVAQLSVTPITQPRWSFDSGSIVGANPADTNVAVSSTHVCITTRAGFKCFTKSGKAVSPGMAKCDTNGNPITPTPFAAGPQWAYKFFSRSCTYVAADAVADGGSTKDGRIVFGSTYKRFFMVFQNRKAAYNPARLLIAVSKSEDPRDGWWTYVDEVGGNNNSLDFQFLGVNSSILVVSNKMKQMDGNNKMLREWTDHTIYGVAELAKGSASYVKKIWPPYNQELVCAGCAEQPPFGPYNPSDPPAYKSATAPEFKAAACVHESATPDFFWIHRDDNSHATIFGRRDGRVTSRRVELQPGFNPVDAKQKDNNLLDTVAAPPVRFASKGVGFNYQNCVVRNNKLVAVANIGQKWANNPAGDVVTTAVRLVRINLSNFFATTAAPPVEIDRIFGKTAVDDPSGQIFDYGMPAVATNASGDIVVGSIRTRETIYPEQRATLRLASDSDIRSSVSIRTGLDMAGGEHHMAGAAADPASKAVYLAQEYPIVGGISVWVTKMLGTNMPDVIPLSVTVPSTMTRGTPYATSLKIMNQGDAAMPAFTAKLHLSTDAVVDAYDLGLASFSVRSLAAGATVDVPVNITIPATSAAGSYYVGARVDIDHAALEYSDTNNANPFIKSGRGNASVKVQ
jgi:hypothetical protein